MFEEPEDPTSRSFFSEIISSISDVKLSSSGRYMISRDYLSVKVWDLHMETKPIESYPVSFIFVDVVHCVLLGLLLQSVLGRLRSRASKELVKPGLYE